MHIKLLNSDGVTYGVGEPIVTYLSARIPNGDAFAKATTVKVNGQVVDGAWHFENSDQDIAAAGYPIEGHFRANPAPAATTPFWPAHANIEMDLRTQGVATAPGSGQYFDDSLTLRFSTGAAQISYVDCGALTMISTSDGVQAHPTMPISCGKTDTPTYEGTKVVMQKGEDVPGTNTPRPNGTVLMTGTGYTNVPILWSVRVTQSGEYVHDLQSNAAIGSASTSHGCTNLHADDAKWFYGWAQLGDVLIYSNSGGGTMPSWDGLGDWNLPQSEFNNETPDS